MLVCSTENGGDEYVHPRRFLEKGKILRNHGGRLLAAARQLDDRTCRYPWMEGLGRIADENVEALAVTER